MSGYHKYSKLAKVVFNLKLMSKNPKLALGIFCFIGLPKLLVIRLSSNVQHTVMNTE